MMYEGKVYDNCYRRGYSEAYALQMLLRMAEYGDDETAELELGTEAVDHEHFTISIAGRSIDFILGGPQHEALCKFVDHIASENFYYVNHKKSRVVDCHHVRTTDYCPYKEDHGKCDGFTCEACEL